MQRAFVHPMTLAAVALTFAACGSKAAVLHVPEDYGTIQKAIDASAAGDSVLVGPGTWNQREIRELQVCFVFQTKASVAFLKPGISLIATAGPEATILDGGLQDVAAVETVMLASLDGPPTRIEGFTLTGGGDGIAVGCTNSAVSAVNCWIVDNAMIGINTASAKVSLIDCVVARNLGTEQGAFLEQGSDFEAIRTRFEANSAGAIRGVGDADRIHIEDCEFVDHAVGRAIAIVDCPDVTLRGTLFLRNRVGTGTGGAVLVNGCSSLIEFCTFAYDSSRQDNVGAVSIIFGSAMIRNNTFFRCSTPFAGAAIGISQANATVTRNVAAECTGAAFALFSGGTLNVPASGCNVLWNNTAPYFNWDPSASATDVHADPEFCGPESLDLTLRASSPAAPANSGDCGQIGAHGVGCGAVSVEPTTWGRIKAAFR